MSTVEPIQKDALQAKDHVLSIGKDYIPKIESRLRSTILGVFADSSGESGELSDREMLAEAVFWSVGELINNANKANNRWALLRNALIQRVVAEKPDTDRESLSDDVDYAIEHNQTEMLKKYGLHNIDLTSSILKLIEKHRTNSFALSEKFDKRIDLTLRMKKKSGFDILLVNCINNSPITVVDKERVEYNLSKVKEDLIEAGRNPFEATRQLYERAEDHSGGGFGAGLRSIVLFLKEGYSPFNAEIVYSRLIQYRSASNSTIFSIELPVP